MNCEKSLQLAHKIRLHALAAHQQGSPHVHPGHQVGKVLPAQASPVSHPVILLIPNPVLLRPKTLPMARRVLLLVTQPPAANLQPNSNGQALTAFMQQVFPRLPNISMLIITKQSFWMLPNIGV